MQICSMSCFQQMPSGRSDVTNQDVIQALKNRIVPKLSDDEVSLFVYFPFQIFIRIETKVNIGNVYIMCLDVCCGLNAS